jgi:hypothetical protein
LEELFWEELFDGDFLGLVPLFDLLAPFDFPELPEDLAWEEEDP